MPRGRKPGGFKTRTVDSLLALCEPEPNSGCWYYMGILNPGGYGGICFRGRRIGIHRAMYQVAIGPIPAGMDVCHKCDVRCCINPNHLFVGTRRENLADMDRKGRRVPPRGERHAKAKLTEADVRAIWADIRRGDRLLDIGPRYGISHITVSSIKNGKCWAHLGEKL